MKAGSLRSDEARARIGMFATGSASNDIPREKFYDVSGYWAALYYYGPVSHDAARQLSRYLSDEHRKELDEILAASDREGAELTGVLAARKEG